MQVKELYNAIDGVAPFAISRAFCENFGMYDNSGVQLDCGGEITGVLFSLDLSFRAIEEAKKKGYNCIVTHHPAIFAKLGSLTPTGAGAAILGCAREGISVISAHLNLDGAAGGIDEQLMRALGGNQPIAVMEAAAGGGYGRVYDVGQNAPFQEFLADIKRELRAERVITYGDGAVARIASFCGAGFDEKALAFALAHGADTIISSDGKHHLILAAVEKGMKVVLLTHYACEQYGFARFAKQIGKLIKGTPCTVFTDKRFL